MDFDVISLQIGSLNTVVEEKRCFIVGLAIEIEEFIYLLSETLHVNENAFKLIQIFGLS